PATPGHRGAFDRGLCVDRRGTCGDGGDRLRQPPHTRSVGQRIRGGGGFLFHGTFGISPVHPSADFRGWKVPEVLLSGNHRKIEEWRRRESLRRTWERRPDLLEHAELTEEDRAYLRRLEQEGKPPSD